MDPRLYSSPPPPPYPYYSPPPPPPKPPKCHDTTPPPPPKPPKCNDTVPPSPPPPSPSPPPPYPYYSPPPPSPPCNFTPICECICPPPKWPPYVPPPYAMTPLPTPGGDNNVTYIAVFVSLGGVFLLAFLAAGLFCWAKKRKEGLVMIPAEAEACVDEHQHIQETITTGPCGEQTVNLTIDNDRQIHEISEAGIIVSGSDHPQHHDKTC